MIRETSDPAMKRYSLVYDELQEDDEGDWFRYTDAQAAIDSHTKPLHVRIERLEAEADGLERENAVLKAELGAVRKDVQAAIKEAVEKEREAIERLRAEHEAEVFRLHVEIGKRVIGAIDFCKEHGAMRKSDVPWPCGMCAEAKLRAVEALPVFTCVVSVRGRLEVISAVELKTILKGEKK